MNLLLVESVTAGAFDRTPDAALLPEAEAMLGAMVAEVTARPAGTSLQLQARVLRQHSLPGLAGGNAGLAFGAATADMESDTMAFGSSAQPVASRVECVVVPEGGWSRVWRDALVWADAVWLIAPETGGQLARLSSAVEAAGARLLGASSESVKVSASKSACHAALAGRVRQPADVSDAAGWVLKPDDGVAAEGVRRVPPLPPTSDVPPAAPEGLLAQPFVVGDPLSLCVLSDGRDTRVLAVNRQRIEWHTDGTAKYRGGVTNAIPDRERFAPLARTVQACIPGLWGYWGIDLVLPPDDEPVLIEVNPRLTTAFVHLRAATGLDQLGALLALADGAALDALPDVPPGHPVAFRLDGTLEMAP